MAPHDIATRASVVTLKAIDLTTTEVASLTGVPTRTVNKIFANAIERGFDPQRRPLTIRNYHVEEAPRSGRPTKQTPELKEALLSKVRDDGDGRQKTCAELADDLGRLGYKISGTSVLRVLRESGYRKTQRTQAEKGVWVYEKDKAGSPEMDEAGSPEIDEAGSPENDEAGSPEIDEAGSSEIDEAGSPEIDETGSTEMESMLSTLNLG
ncbi:uncharacterized protein CPUR_08005 [Claviceps purpurea 20.1]|uniref:Transposase Tc1-like domain-containing protein n=1 Tax=Claviceps purpurea (strain 20.1) TaxID=1111077 RepID=M1WI92_CLAP2|nr:uncharacterized protein CPUR_08005 [Claviceps purpurea 20.1]